MKNTHVFIAMIIALTICTGGFVWVKQELQERRTDAAAPVSAIAGMRVGGPFTLINQDGKTVTQDDYKGRYLFVYFGFTFCPAICPTELHKMSEVLKGLDEQSRQKIQPLFVTVDPERDTVTVMKNYISLFHEDFQGLTGTTEQVKDMTRAWKVFASKSGDLSGDEYTVDHSSYIYFLSPAGDLLNLFRIQDNQDVMLRDIKASLGR